MRLSRATNSAKDQPNMSPALCREGGLSDLWDLGTKREADVLVVDVSIKYAPQGPGEIAALKAYLSQLSGDIDSGKFLKDLVAKLQGTSWGDVPNHHGTRIQVFLPEGVTPPDAIDSGKVRGLPSWVRGDIQFKNEPFMQQKACAILTAPRSLYGLVLAD
jgi:hypothetical protein